MRLQGIVMWKIAAVFLAGGVVVMAGCKQQGAAVVDGASKVVSVSTPAGQAEVLLCGEEIAAVVWYDFTEEEFGPGTEMLPSAGGDAEVFWLWRREMADERVQVSYTCKLWPDGLGAMAIRVLPPTGAVDDVRRLDRGRVFLVRTWPRNVPTLMQVDADVAGIAPTAEGLAELAERDERIREFVERSGFLRDWRKRLAEAGIDPTRDPGEVLGDEPKPGEPRSPYSLEDERRGQ